MKFLAKNLLVLITLALVSPMHAMDKKNVMEGENLHVLLPSEPLVKKYADALRTKNLKKSNALRLKYPSLKRTIQPLALKLGNFETQFLECGKAKNWRKAYGNLLFEVLTDKNDANDVAKKVEMILENAPGLINEAHVDGELTLLYSSLAVRTNLDVLEVFNKFGAYSDNFSLLQAFREALGAKKEKSANWLLSKIETSIERERFLVTMFFDLLVGLADSDKLDFFLKKYAKKIDLVRSEREQMKTLGVSREDFSTRSPQDAVIYDGNAEMLVLLSQHGVHIRPGVLLEKIVRDRNIIPLKSARFLVRSLVSKLLLADNVSKQVLDVVTDICCRFLGYNVAECSGFEHVKKYVKVVADILNYGFTNHPNIAAPAITKKGLYDIEKLLYRAASELAKFDDKSLRYSGEYFSKVPFIYVIEQFISKLPANHSFRTTFESLFINKIAMQENLLKVLKMGYYRDLRFNFLEQ